MTPTVKGRHQTRLFLTLFVGVPVSIPFCLFVGLFPLAVLVLVLLVGLVLDHWYDQIQKRRWDHDWPVHWQVKAGFLEFGALVAALVMVGAQLRGAMIMILPMHYFTVWIVQFALLQGPIRVLFPAWRYNGGRIQRT